MHLGVPVELSGTCQPCGSLSLEKSPVGSTQVCPERQLQGPVSCQPLSDPQVSCLFHSAPQRMSPSSLTGPDGGWEDGSVLQWWLQQDQQGCQDGEPSPPGCGSQGSIPSFSDLAPWGLMTGQDWWGLCHCFPDVTHPHPHLLPSVLVTTRLKPECKPASEEETCLNK